jgi:hypothetical protein
MENPNRWETQLPANPSSLTIALSLQDIENFVRAERKQTLDRGVNLQYHNLLR